MRAIFLAEMRMVLVRIVFARDEIAQVGQSHTGRKREEMLAGITAMHERIRAHNPRWLLELLSQLPAAAEEQMAVEREGGRVRLSELREMAHRAGPWWR